MPAKRALIMHPTDNVATAVEEIQDGEEVAIPVVGTALTLRAIEAIPFGFKIALQEISQGQIIRKYGETIGTASQPIAKEPWCISTTWRHARSGRPGEEGGRMSFLGYVRSDGTVGTRNYILVIPQGSSPSRYAISSPGPRGFSPSTMAPAGRRTTGSRSPIC